MAGAKKQNFSSTKTNWHQQPHFDNLNKTAVINFQAIQGGAQRANAQQLNGDH